MSKPFIHAKSSAAKFGGKPDDYLPIHDLIDSSKQQIADPRHRALLHSTFGCFIVERVFGAVATNSEGKEYSPRDVAEMHCLEDLGHIPTVNDWLAELPIKEWMGGGKKEDIPSASPLAAFVDMKAKAAAVKKSMSDTLVLALTELFEASPFSAIRWTQYTPSFNDGDPCTFGVREPYFLCGKVSKDRLDSDQDDDDGDGWKSEYSLPDEVKVAGKDIASFIESSDEAMEVAFGDGKQITWIRGRKKFKVEDYDCGY